MSAPFFYNQREENDDTEKMKAENTSWPVIVCLFSIFMLLCGTDIPYIKLGGKV